MTSQKAKKAFLVLGAESSGTRMMAQALMSSGVAGSGGHFQPFDRQPFVGEMVLLRRSLPHSHTWPDIEAIKKRMEAEGYAVTTIGIKRNERYVIPSQIRAGHVRNANDARLNINKANAIIDQHADVVVQYSRFVHNADRRAEAFEQIGLPAPRMEFYDANAKYN